MNDHPLQSQFRDAWNDLRTRLDRGGARLKELGEAQEMVGTPTGDAEASRIARKSAAVKNARTAWENLHQQAMNSSDYAAAWRTFTDQVVADWQDAPHQDFQDGYALVLDYQRGYGPDVDAPALISMRERRWITRSGS